MVLEQECACCIIKMVRKHAKDLEDIQTITVVSGIAIGIMIQVI